jgi:hypothetical protein
MMNQDNIRLANIFSSIESKLDSVLTDNFILKNEVHDIKQCIRTDHSTQGNVSEDQLKSQFSQKVYGIMKSFLEPGKEYQLYEKFSGFVNDLELLRNLR